MGSVSGKGRKHMVDGEACHGSVPPVKVGQCEVEIPGLVAPVVDQINTELEGTLMNSPRF